MMKHDAPINITLRLLLLAAVTFSCGGGGGSAVSPDGELVVAEVDTVSVLLAGPPAEKRCIVIAGQSNARGIGQAFDLTPETLFYADPYKPVLEAQRQMGGTEDVQHAFAPVGPQVPWTATPRFGIDVRLARDLVAARPSTRWVLIKAGFDGTNLAVDWAPGGATFVNVHDWIDAQAALQGCTPAAYIWIQGENDATSSSRANAYGTNLTAYVNAIRARYGAIPFIYGRLVATGVASFEAQVRAGQAALATSNSHMVDQDGFEMNGVHFTGLGLVNLGARYSAKVLEVVP
jgi:hypothetical protein